MSIFSFIMTARLTLEVYSSNNSLPLWMVFIGNWVTNVEHFLHKLIYKNIKMDGIKDIRVRLEELEYDEVVYTTPSYPDGIPVDERRPGRRTIPDMHLNDIKELRETLTVVAYIL